MKKLLITWAKWMLAHDLTWLAENSYKLILSDIEEMDITSEASITTFFEQHTPDVVVNCAAYTAVDKAENEWMLLNYKVNTLWQWLLAKKCTECNIPWITISTDYVFDGEKKEGYVPSDRPNPLNQYGMAKYLWEQLAFQHNPNTIVLRTSRLYGWGKEFKNFVNTMMRLWKEKDSLKVIDDQMWLPTYTADLANYILHILGNVSTYSWKILHANNSWIATSRYWFAKEIFLQTWIDVNLSSCTSQEYLLPAKRPWYSMMLSNDVWYQFPKWESSLNKYLERIHFK